MSLLERAVVPPAGRSWRSLAWWFRGGSTGKIVLFQPPNATILVAQAATAVQTLNLLPDRRREVAWIKFAALSLWAVDELLRGTTPFRRVLGIITLGSQVARRLR